MGQTLLFESRKSLYAVPWPHQGMEKPRHIAELLPSSYEESSWTASPDGRHIAYRSPDIPECIRVAMLPGMRGDQVLFTIPRLSEKGAPLPLRPHDLRSASGAVVKSVDGCYEMGDLGILDILWCTRHTLLVNMKQASTIPGFATCAVDLRSGRAMHTDNEGVWQSLNQSSGISAVGNILLGCGVGRTTDEQSVCNMCSQFYPIEISDVRRPQTVRTLLSGGFDSKHIPAYGLAECPVLSPDGRTIAFSSSNSHDMTKGDPGIWTVDRHTRHYHRLTHERYVQQLVWESPDSLLFLKWTDKPNDPGSVDLFRLLLHDHGRRAGKPVFLLSNIDRIQLLDHAL